MAGSFEYSVFLDFHPDDREAASRVHEGLRSANLRVWSTEADSTAEAVERAANASRTSVLIVSDSTLGAGWPIHERRTAPFRDPAEIRRRFVPVLLNGKVTGLPENLRHYRTIDLGKGGKKPINDIVAACRAASKLGIGPPRQKNHRIATLQFNLNLDGDVTELVETPSGEEIIFGSGHEIDIYQLRSNNYRKNIEIKEGKIKSLALSPDGKLIAAGLDNGNLRIFDLDKEGNKRILAGHDGAVVTLEWTRDGRLMSGGGDSTLRLWRPSDWKCQAELRGHTGGIGQVIALADGMRAITASYDGLIKVWDIVGNKCLATLKGHDSAVNSVAILPEGTHLLSCSDDCTVRLWDMEAGNVLASMEGHRDTIWRVIGSPDGRITASGGWDNTVRIWDTWRGSCLQVLPFPDIINFIEFGRDGGALYIGSGDTLHVYRINKKLANSVSTLESDTRRYSNAKVVLVGESTVGKSCLANRLVVDRWKIEESTHGMRVWPLKLEGLTSVGVEREVWLWDLAGQPDYRLTHQIFLDETALALVLFDPSHPDDPFQGIGHWEKALRQATKREPAKLLIATKTDRSSIAITAQKIEQFLEQRGYAVYVETSAKTGRGRDNLLKAIAGNIPWDKTPWITTPRLFKILKDRIIRIKEEGLCLIQFAALRQQLQLSLPKERFDEADLRTVVRLLAGQGLIKPLKFGDIILLKPELMSNYAAAVVRAAREHVEGIGCISERKVLQSNFDFQDMPRLARADEEILLRAVVQTFLEESLCMRQETSEGDQLVFPSQYKRELELPERPVEIVTYRFAGNLADIYTTLVVRLRYTEGFEEPELWKNAAIFLTHDNSKLGFAMVPAEEGAGRLKLFFEPTVSEDTRITFFRYIHDHLEKYAVEVERQRHYVCPESNCGQPFNETNALRIRIAAGKTFVRCAYCDSEIPIVDLIEQKFRDGRFEKRVRELEEKASINLDNESKELVLVGHAFSTAGEANQIFRPIPNSDHGIDGEIEFKNERGEASGQRIYIQLKSGDSYTYRRAADGTEVFTVKNPRHLEYWQNHAYPVYLVVRTSDAAIRWMNLSQHLRDRTDKESLQIIFVGEPFNAYSLIRVANRMLP